MSTHHHTYSYFMITKLPYLTLAAMVLIAFTARADDDYAWGATTGSSMVEIDATTGQSQPLYLSAAPPISASNFSDSPQCSHPP